MPITREAREQDGVVRTEPLFKTVATFGASALLLLGTAAGQSRTDRDVCPDMVTTLVPQLVFKKPINALQRLEIRSCMPGQSENLQFVAWENGATKPSLVVTTSDEAIVQLAMSGGVFVIETTGGSHSFVFVIVFEGGTSFRTGKPKLALQAVTKSDVNITSDHDHVSVSYVSLRGERRRFEYSTGM